MSMADVDALVAKAQAEPAFHDALFQDFDGTVKSQGFSLNADERLLAQKRLSTKAEPANVNFQQIQQDLQARAKQSNDQVGQLKTSAESLFKQTMEHATWTFKMITIMNQVMFWMGVVLFLTAAVCTLFLKNVAVGALFAGLGTLSFVAFFLVGPIDKTQAALAHLIQAQIAFMGYYEQLYFIECFASLPNSQTNLPDPERLSKASDLMQERCAQLMGLLGTYLDKRPVAASRTQKARSKPQGTSTA